MRKLILIGLRGSGKTSVGRRAALRLGIPFIDTDRAVVDRAGKTIADIFRDSGEPAFRALEKEAVADALRAPGPAVIAAGGGAVLDPANVAAFRAAGFVVWLTAPIDTLAARVAADSGTAAGRPSLTGRPVALELADLARIRDPLYRTAAHWTLAAGALTVDQAALALAAEYRKRCAPAEREQ
jgi:shikimate kinase